MMAPPLPLASARAFPYTLFWSIRPNHLIFLIVAKKSCDGERERLQALLRQLRIEAGLRQADLAQELGFPQTMVSKYELGERRLDLPELDLICGALGISLVEFVKKYRVAVSKDQPLPTRKRLRVNKK